MPLIAGLRQAQARVGSFAGLLRRRRPAEDEEDDGYGPPSGLRPAGPVPSRPSGPSRRTRSPTASSSRAQVELHSTIGSRIRSNTLSRRSKASSCARIARWTAAGRARSGRPPAAGPPTSRRAGWAVPAAEIRPGTQPATARARSVKPRNCCTNSSMERPTSPPVPGAALSDRAPARARRLLRCHYPTVEARRGGATPAGPARPAGAMRQDAGMEVSARPGPAAAVVAALTVLASCSGVRRRAPSEPGRRDDVLRGRPRRAPPDRPLRRGPEPTPDETVAQTNAGPRPPRPGRPAVRHRGAAATTSTRGRARGHRRRRGVHWRAGRRPRRRPRRGDGALAAAAPGPGPWVAVDQEGGAVQTPPGEGFDRLPHGTGAGALPADELAALAESLGSSRRPPGSPSTRAGRRRRPARHRGRQRPHRRFGREYGGTPEEVAAAAGTIVAGLADAGVTADAKHFPGLGRVARQHRRHRRRPRHGDDGGRRAADGLLDAGRHPRRPVRDGLLRDLRPHRRVHAGDVLARRAHRRAPRPARGSTVW